MPSPAATSIRLRTKRRQSPASPALSLRCLARSPSILHLRARLPFHPPMRISGAHHTPQPAARPFPRAKRASRARSEAARARASTVAEDGRVGHKKLRDRAERGGVELGEVVI